MKLLKICHNKLVPAFSSHDVCLSGFSPQYYFVLLKLFQIARDEPLIAPQQQRQSSLMDHIVRLVFHFYCEFRHH